MPGHILVETQKLNVGYGSRTIVEDVSMRIEAGELVTIIGPNGAGKSTLLRTIAGHIPPISGDVMLDGRRIRDISVGEIARIVAVLFTGDIPKERITNWDVVAMGRYPYTGILGKLSREDIRIVDEALELTGTTQLKNQIFTELSDGQRQRILLARALCQEPRILILDEPTTFLDIRYRLEFIDLLSKLSKKKGFAVLMSLHELDMVRQISDRIVCIKDKKIVKIGNPDEVFTTGFINDLYDITVGTYDESRLQARLNG